MEFYLTMRKDEILQFAVTWINLENILLIEVNWKERDKYSMTSLL